MMYLERKSDGPITLVIECVNDNAFNVAATAIDCFSWDPDLNDDPDILRAANILDLDEDEGLEEGEKLIIIGKGKKNRRKK